MNSNSSCENATDVVKNISVLQSVSIKSFHCICVYGMGKQSRPKQGGTYTNFLFDLILNKPVNNFSVMLGRAFLG